MLFLRALVATLIAGSITFTAFRFTMWKEVDNNPLHLSSMWLGSTISMAAAGLAVGLVAALVMLAFKKSFGRSFAHSYSAAVLLVAMLACLGSFIAEATQRRLQQQMRAIEADQAARAEKKAQSDEALRGMQEDKARMLEEIKNAEGSSTGTKFRFESEEPKDATSSYRHLQQSLLNDSVALRNEYQQAIKDSGLLQLLDGPHLAADKDFKKSRAILAHCNQLVKDYKEKSREVVTSIPQRLDRYPAIPADEKKEFLAGHHEVMSRKMEETDAPWNAEAEVLGIWGEAIDYLADTRSEWTVKDGKLLFQTDESLARFRAVTKKFEACMDKQRKLAEQSLEEAKSKSGGRKGDPEKR